MSTSFLTKKNQSGTRVNLWEKREKRVHKRQAEQVLKSNSGQEGTKLTDTIKALHGEDSSNAVDKPLTSTGPGLSASTSPGVASLLGKGDSITSSFLTLLLLVLHLSACILGWKRKSESLQVGQLWVPGRTRRTHASGPRKERQLASQAQVVSPAGWVCRGSRVGGHASEGQPPGVLLLLGKGEVPTRRPKENKPQTVQYTVYCLSDKDQPHCVCSTQCGPNRPKSKQCSA